MKIPRNPATIPGPRMINLDSILEAASKQNSKEELQLIRKAYEYSEKAHAGQKRKSGEPYFYHPVEVAYILAAHKWDSETIATGLLHDVVEDTLVSVEDVETKFGPNVAHLVDAVTKLSKVSFKSKDVRQAESFRKMLLAMSTDIRVIIIKLADRLHNMRTLDYMTEPRQIAIAQETLDIYAPLANRLGIAWMRTELEDLAFRYLKPDPYVKIVQNLRDTAPERDNYISKVISDIGNKMKEENIKGEVTGRPKSPYSIYRKMNAQNLDFDEVADILAFRIIVDSLPECYEALGHIHTQWKPVPGRFKDYVALPKANMYQSLHTTVIGPEGRRIEIQIRTKQMHQTAEEGFAAHWLYKEEKGSKADVESFSWLRSMLDWQQDLKDSHEFIETVKMDLFANEVYVFTPNGEVLDFPRGSTPIDFAYRIHSDVGHHCQGARVNGKIVPLKYKMKNGDTVEVVTSDQARPSKDWLKIVVTSKAKSKIRSVIKNEQRQTGRTIGLEILEKELRKHSLKYDKLLKEGKIKLAVSELGYGEPEDYLLALGYGKASPHDLVDRLVPEKERKGKVAPGVLQTIVNRVIPTKKSPIRVSGMDDVMVRYGKCCDPLPGDKILGFITRGRGITIHRTDCYKILETDNERKIDVEWAKDGRATRSINIKVVSVDTPGILAGISKIISQKGGNITHASITTTQDRKAVNMFSILITDSEQLHTLMRTIEKMKGILSVERVKS